MSNNLKPNDVEFSAECLNIRLCLRMKNINITIKLFHNRKHGALAVLRKVLMEATAVAKKYFQLGKHDISMHLFEE